MSSWVARVIRRQLRTDRVQTLASGFLATFLVCLWFVGFGRVLNRSDSWGELTVGAGYLAALVGLQLWFFRPAQRSHRPHVVVTLLATQAVLAFLPFLHYSWWLGVPGIFVGSALLLLRPRSAVPLALAAVLSIGALGGFVGEPGGVSIDNQGYTAAFFSITTLMTGVTVYGLTRLADVAGAIHRTRDEVARLAATQERLRFSQELRERVGVQLSAIGSTAQRITPALAGAIQADAGQVRSEITELVATSRNALGQVRSLSADDIDEVGDARDRPDRVAPATMRLAGVAVLVVFLCFGALIISEQSLFLRNASATAATCVYLTVILSLQARYVIRPPHQRQPVLALGVLAAQAVIIYVAVAQYGGLWLTMPALLAANALVLLRLAISVPIAVGVLVSVGWIYAPTDPWWESFVLVGHPLIEDVAPTFFVVEWSLTAVVATYGMTWLGMLVVDLQETQRQLSDTAVHEERWRLARDVHDLLGLGLSAITLKAELANKLAIGDPGRATTELAEISVLSRQALGDVRSVADGERDLRLDEELRSARALLTSAQVEVEIVGAGIDVPEPLSSVLAAVIREGATNVLRHSKANKCQITLTRTSNALDLEIANDGVLTEQLREQLGSGGSGVRNLIHRLSRVDGRLTSGVAPDGQYRLRATVPLSGTG
ncbi:histidine kinase [Phytoactinopolyspora endophytica]|uniref:sensor histidine kinase n=1 Tax=Phytoactinopolyspora endophytica TaxID=1642495 RepID=UPI00101C03F7|nr:histidine kinase [Phytoactinopolyspora endophytica]